MRRNFVASSIVSSTGNRSLSLLALAATLAVAPLLGGCDNSTGKADKAILTGVTSVQPATSAEEGLKNITILEPLTKQEGASTGRLALAKAALAAAELQTAEQYTKDVQAQELLAAQKIWEIEGIASQIQSNKVLIDAAARRDPSVPLPAPVLGETTITEDLKTKAAAAREGDAWVKNDTVPLATVSSIKQTISTLNGKITDIKSNIDTLIKQRDQAMIDAGKSQQDSEAAKGDDSEKAYIKAADLRKQAALTNVQIEAAQASLVPLNADLTTAQAHEKIVTDAASQFDTAGQTYADGYAKIKAQADKLTADSKDLLGGAKDSIVSKIKELNDLTDAADVIRGKAIEQYKAAIAHYGDAVTDSEKVKTEQPKDIPPGSPDETLNKAITAAAEASNLRLCQAEANAGRGAVESAHTLLLSRKAAVLKSANAAATAIAVAPPAELTDAKNATDLSEARTNADEAYKAADDALDNIISGGGSPKTKTEARITRAVVNVGWSQLAATAGDTENAKARLSAAQQLQKDAMEDQQGVIFPAYLSTLTETATAAPATPAAPAKPAAEQPATAPAAPAAN